MLFKQNTPYGCGLYALANALNNESIITEKRLKKSKDGNTMGQLTKWLWKSGYKIWFIEALYLNLFSNNKPVKEEFISIRAMGENEAAILLLQVTASPESKSHLIAVEVYNDGACLLKDSLKQDVEVTTLEQIYDENYIISGIFVFSTVDGGNRITKILKEQS